MGEKVLQKNILLSRLKKIAEPVAKDYGNNEFSIVMFFDDEIWREKDVEKQKDIIVKKKIKLRDVPSSCYGFRSIFLRRIKDCSQDDFSFKDLEKIFDKSDNLVLGDFEDISSGTGIIAKTNEWYYKAMGARAFTSEGKVPTRFSNDKYFYLANAKNFYKRALKSNLDEYIVQRWGAGTNLASVEAFLTGLEYIDKNKRIFSKTKYIFSDYSKESIKDARREALKNERLKKYMDLGILVFEVIDAMNPPAKYRGKVFYIESSYLYDSLPQDVLAKVNGKFYKILYRGYIDERAKIYLNSGKEILPSKLVRLLQADDWTVIKNLELKSFDAINGEIKLKLVNIEQIKYGKEIKELVKDLNNVRIPNVDVIVESLKKAMDCLVKDGYIQVFDISATAKGKDKLKIWGSFNRYHGAVYTGVNFELIKRVIDSLGLKIGLEYGADYVGRVLEEDLFPLCDVLGMMKSCSELAKKSFGLEMLKSFDELKRINDVVMKEFGYGEDGRREFKKGLAKIEWLNWDGKITRYKMSENYLDDLYKSLLIYLSGRVGDMRSRNLWLSHRRKNNKEFRALLDKTGYRADEVVDVIFREKKNIYPSMAYYCMTLEK